MVQSIISCQIIIFKYFSIRGILYLPSVRRSFSQIALTHTKETLVVYFGNRRQIKRKTKKDTNIFFLFFKNTYRIKVNDSAVNFGVLKKLPDWKVRVLYYSSKVSVHCRVRTILKTVLDVCENARDDYVCADIRKLTSTSSKLSAVGLLSLRPGLYVARSSNLIQTNLIHIRFVN